MRVLNIRWAQHGVGGACDDTHEVWLGIGTGLSISTAERWYSIRFTYTGCPLPSGRQQYPHHTDRRNSPSIIRSQVSIDKVLHEVLLAQPWGQLRTTRPNDNARQSSMSDLTKNEAATILTRFSIQPDISIDP